MSLGVKIPFSTNSHTKHEFFLVSESQADFFQSRPWFVKHSRNGHYTIVSNATSSEKASGEPWYIKAHRYALGRKKGDPTVVDHLNHWTDNRVEALRATDSQGNGRYKSLSKRNTSGFKGVTPTRHGTFGAAITLESKRRHLGTFPTAIDAAKAYDEAAIEHYKEYAKTNKSMGLYE